MEFKMIIYTAGPITGMSWEQATVWRKQLVYALPNVEVISPLRGKLYLMDEKEIKAEYDTNLSCARGFTTRDRWDVTRADIVVANFLNTSRVSIGTVMELAWADLLRKPIVVILDEYNPNNHPMVREVAGYVVETLEEAIEVCHALIYNLS
jgi:nucleoside 2-deoxyribosyltransferase